MERAELARKLYASLSQAGHSDRSGVVAEACDVVVVEEREPARFCVAFADAVAAGGTVFLANPGWGAAERAQFNALVATKSLEPRAGDGLFATGSEMTAPSAAPGQSTRANLKSKNDEGWLCIPTGGSTGKLKLARHDEDTLHAAARGFAEHFCVRRVNAVGVLPLHHVGGLMGWLRCALTGGEFVATSWKEIEAGVVPLLPARDDGWFLSLVPTQLQRLLAQPPAVAWLRGFRAVLVGGGAAWPELVAAGAQAKVPLAFTYGTTETAAAVAALRPEEFLAGGRGCGTALPHARVSVDGAGTLVVEGTSLFRGYWPGRREVGPWVTEDTGVFDEHGSLCVLGRRDSLIITGGEKVPPGEVEAALRATGEFEDVAVVGVPDGQWGSIVVACYPTSGREPDFARVVVGLERLAVWKRPKRFVPLATWPRDAAGKVNRLELARQAGEQNLARG